MTTVYFVRHGFVHNPDSVFYGRLPGFPISEEGIVAARYFGQQLTDKNIEMIFHSPILRAVQTAEEIQKVLQAPLTADSRLTEVETGLDGKIRHTPIAYPETHQEGAESIGEIYQRMGDFLREVLGQYKDKTVVAVSHGGPLRILEMGLLGQPMNEHGYRSQPVLECATGMVVRCEGNEFTVERLT